MPYVWYFFGGPSEIEESLTLTLDLTQDQAYGTTYSVSVSSTLVPVQSTGKVLPEVTNYLELEQEIRSSIHMASVTTTLSPTQTFYLNIKNGEITLTLEPIQEIDTSGSTLSNASQQEETLELGITFSDGGTFTHIVEMILEPVNSPVGYIVSRTGYRPEHVWLTPYSSIPRTGWGNFLMTGWWPPFSAESTIEGWVG